MFKQRNSTRLITTASFLILLLPATSLWATPPQGSVQTVVPPQTPSTPPGGQSGFDWQGWLGGVLEGMERGQERYPTPQRTPSYPGYRIYRPPYRVQPMQPRYVQPERVRVPSNVTEVPAVQPEPNEVVVKVPPQPSPLLGRVWEASVRESRCYAKGLRDKIEVSLAEFMNQLPKGADRAAFTTQLDHIKELLGHNAPWQEMEPVVRRLLEENRTTFSNETMAMLEHMVRVILVRDAFVMAGRSEPRGRGSAIPVGGIPTGMIWVVYDPTLPWGTALLVNERVLVCGSDGHGELEIVYTSAAAGMGLPVAAGEPLPNISDEEAEELKGEFTIISNREDAGTAVHYVLNRNQPFTIEPGFKQKLPPDRSWIIQFDRGAGGGTAMYSLTKGYYEFRVVEGRWDLVRRKFDVTIDNREGVHDFQYVVNNEIVTVPAGKIQKHESAEPILVEFDRGEGSENPSRKNLNKSGTYKVAVDIETNYLDLFAVGDQAAGEGPPTG